MAFVRWSGIRPLLDALRRHCETGSRCGSSRRRTPTAPSTRARRAGGARRRDQGLVRHGVDAAARQGVAVPPRERLLDGVHRIVEPDALGAGHRARVERARLGRAQSRRRREDGRRLRVLLGERRLRPVRPRRVRASGRRRASASRRCCSSPVEIVLRPFQERLLEQVDARAPPGPPPQPPRRRDRHRQDGHGRGRLRAPSRDACRATGCSSSRTARRSSTRAARRSATRCATRRFGEFWVGGKRPSRFEHVFASIQSLNASGLESIDPTHFDVVIVDEFHHAAAPSYEALLERSAAASSCSA